MPSTAPRHRRVIVGKGRLRLHDDHTARERSRGSSSLEVVILAPALLLFLLLAIYGGRLALARQSIHAAAVDAARSASISRTATAATENARAAARATMRSEGLNCTTSEVTVDTSAFATRVGTASRVSATVTCSLDLRSIALPGVRQIRHLSATAVSPLDTYRER